MSDFLTRLAERALGLGARVQPKLPRRFAAVTPVENPAVDAWREELSRFRTERLEAAESPAPGTLAPRAAERPR